jgi:hypothetical protein
MAMRKIGLFGLMAIVALLLARAFFWPQASPLPPRPSAVPTAPSANSNVAGPNRAKPATASTRSTPPPSTLSSNPTPYQYRNPNDPKALFENPATSVAERFAALAHLAQAGNQDAKYFALQIARHCTDISKIPDDQPPVGQAAATSYQIRLRAQMKAACVLAMSDAAFPEYARMLEAREPELFAERMRQTLELFFADKGPDEAIHAAVSAIAQRPDDFTVGMVGDIFADLDIASVYFQPEVASAAPADPKKRIELTRFALNLLACYYGRPCGPNSFVVQSTCTQLGACLPGADLLGVYESQMLNAQDMAYVRLLLEYLKQFPPNVVWG